MPTTTSPPDVDQLQAQVDQLTRQRDRLQLRVDALGEVLNIAERGGATVLPITTVRQLFALARPKSWSSR